MLPLVGWAPLHPPEAVQLCASVALHCRVAAVPMTTLVFVAARVTTGIAVPPGTVGVVWTDACPQAARAEITEYPTAERSRREAQAEHNARRLGRI
jgi:hypothetical protein